MKELHFAGVKICVTDSMPSDAIAIFIPAIEQTILRPDGSVIEKRIIREAQGVIYRGIALPSR